MRVISQYAIRREMDRPVAIDVSLGIDSDILDTSKFLINDRLECGKTLFDLVIAVYDDSMKMVVDEIWLPDIPTDLKNLLEFGEENITITDVHTSTSASLQLDPLIGLKHVGS